MSMIKVPKLCGPYLTQDGGDREEGEDQYIANVCDGSTIGYKYFNTVKTTKCAVKVCGNATGELLVKDSPKGDVLARISVWPTKKEAVFSGDFSGGDEKQALFFQFTGKGKCDFYAFSLK